MFATFIIVGFIAFLFAKNVTIKLICLDVSSFDIADGSIMETGALASNRFEDAAIWFLDAGRLNGWRHARQRLHIAASQPARSWQSQCAGRLAAAFRKMSFRNAGSGNGGQYGFYFETWRSISPRHCSNDSSLDLSRPRLKFCVYLNDTQL